MLLTADIGNTNIVLALLDEKDRVVSQCRVPSGDPLPPEAYDDAIRRVLEGQAAPEGAAIGDRRRHPPGRGAGGPGGRSHHPRRTGHRH